jgi:hypothetical protein
MEKSVKWQVLLTNLYQSVVFEELIAKFEDSYFK